MMEVIQDTDRKKIVEASSEFEALSEVITVLENIGKQYLNEMNTVHSFYGKKNIDINCIEPENNEEIYGIRQMQLYDEYSSKVMVEKSHYEEELRVIKSNLNHDIDAIKATKTERISVINAYEEAYEHAKNVLEDPVPRVTFDFIKNQKKILIDCDATRQNLPNKPDMSDVVSELLSEEKRIIQLLNDHYSEKEDECTERHQTVIGNYQKELKQNILNVECERKKREEDITKATKTALNTIFMDEEIFGKFITYSDKRILFEKYDYDKAYEELPDYYDIGAISLKIPDVFCEDKNLNLVFKEVNHKWLESGIITGNNYIRVPLIVPRRRGYSIVLPCLDVEQITSFVLKNSMMFPVGKMKFVAICARTIEVFSPIHALKRQGEHLTGIGTNYCSESEIENKIVNLHGTVNSYSNLFFGKTEIREKKEPFQTVLIYDYDNGFTDKAKKYLADMIDTAPKNGINYVFFCDNIEKIDKNAFGNISLVVTKNKTHYQKETMTISQNGVEYIYDLGDMVSMEECTSIINNMSQYIGQRKEIKYTIEDLLPDINNANTYFAGGTTMDGIDAPIAFLGTDPFDFVIGKSKSDDIRHFTLISGISGAGKTELLHTIMLSIMYRYPPSEVRFCMMDYKEGVGANHFANNPYMRSIIRQGDREAGNKEFENLVQEMLRRFDLFKTVTDETDGTDENGRKVDEIFKYRRLTGDVMPKIIIVVDELSGLTGNDDEISKSVLKCIAEIVQRGRAAGIHMILTAQTWGNTGIDESIKSMFVHRFVCRGDGRATYTEYDSQRENLGEPLIVKDLDTVFVNKFLDKYLKKLIRMFPDSVTDNENFNTYIVSNIISDQTMNPLNSFDLDVVRTKPLRLYLGYNEDNDKIELRGSMLIICSEVSNRKLMVSNACSILTYTILSVLHNNFANKNKNVTLISLIAIEIKDRYVGQIDKLRQLFPDVINAIYAHDSDDDDKFDMCINNIKNCINDLYDEYQKRCTENVVNGEMPSRYLVIYGIHRLTRLHTSVQYDMNTGLKEKDCIAKLKELISMGNKYNIFVIAWLDEGNIEKAEQIFDIQSISSLFNSMITSGIGKDMTNKLIGVKNDKGDDENYAFYKRKDRDTVYEIKLFEMPSDKWLDEFHDKCEDMFNL